MDMELIQQIRGKARSLLEEGTVEGVIGYERAGDGVTSRPLFAYDSSAAERLIFDDTCTHNLVKYLLGKRGKKMAVMVKPCDSRAINLLLNERQIDRDKVFIIGVGCPGVVETEWNHKSETLQARCRSCLLTKPLVYDVLLGRELARKAEEETYSDILEAEAESVVSRREFWREQFSRCIRCYACRQVCPGCYCPVCFAEQLEPLWVGIRIAPEENTLWQTIRTFHLAGRCIGCNECERVCPVDIPLSLLNRKLEKDVKELFAFQAGLDPEEPPPFATFRKEEMPELGE
ncbi:MAG: 4Fe-4S binding protein [Chloroflexi bacterium]|nr:4Fe-4S binding protein [Chloroflexota bacterium]